MTYTSYTFNDRIVHESSEIKGSKNLQVDCILQGEYLQAKGTENIILKTYADFRNTNSKT